MFEKFTIVVVGLGYVGLPLVIRLGSYFNNVIGYDIDEQRILDLKKGVDKTEEVDGDDLNNFRGEFVSVLTHQLNPCIYIVTVPTPINHSMTPNLKALFSACEVISSVLTKQSIVVFESTVFPGCTRELCVPILESTGLKLNVDFGVGYSPERINPGDKSNKVHTINKVLAASDKSTLAKLEKLYSKVIDAKLYLASTIEVAEASKILENTQRDVNIALINEFEEICIHAGIDIHEVLEMSSSKWNFHNYHPGLVGGHCIGVDPYYLVDKAYQLGVVPELISSARRVNEKRVIRVVETIKRLSAEKGKKEILLLGLTFKPNCPDFRNSKAIEVVKRLLKSNLKISFHDPYIKDPNIVAGLPETGFVSSPSYKKFVKKDILVVKLVEHEFYEMQEIENADGSIEIYEISKLLGMTSE